MEELKVNIDGKEHVVRIEEEGNTLKVHHEGNVYNVETTLPNQQKDYDISSSASSDGKQGTIVANLPGIIFSVDVKEGAAVKKDQKVVSLVAMKMENQIKSPIDGTVKKVNVKKDDRVNKGDVLLVIE